MMLITTPKIPQRLFDEITQFCQLNKIENVDAFFIKILTAGFNLEKYGKQPFSKTELKNRLVTGEQEPQLAQEDKPLIVKKKNNDDDDYDVYDY